MSAIQRFVLHPITVMMVSCWGSYGIWLLTSTEFLESYKMLKADPWPGCLIAVAASVAFSAGFFLQWRFASRRPPPQILIDPLVLRQQILFLLGVSVACQGVIMAGMFATGGFSAITDSISGISRGFSIPGVTTLVHVSTGLVPLSIAAFLVARREAPRNLRRAFLTICIVLFLFCVGRAYVMGERIALLTPLISSIVVGFALTQRNPLRKLSVAALIVPIFILVIFTGSEILRSYKIKIDSYSLDRTASGYASERLVLYYVTSVNGGIGEMEMLSEAGMGAPLFKTTFNPLWQVLSAFDIELVTEGQLNAAKSDFLWEEGLRLKEFTNTWGFQTPFGEGRFWGGFYWLVVGYFSGLLYSRIVSATGSIFDYAAYGLLVAALLDSSRVLMLGMVHFLVPLVLLLFLRHRWLARHCRLLRMEQQREMFGGTQIGSPH